MTLSRSILTVVAGRGSLLAAWFLATLLLQRQLGPGAFAVYVLAANFIRLITGCLGDPIDLAVMREAPALLPASRPAALSVVRAAFWLRVIVGLSVVAAVAASPSLASWLIFDGAHFRRLAVWAAAGVLGDLLLRSVLGYFQIAGQFNRFLAVDSVWQLGRAAAVAALLATGHVSIATAVGLYVLGPWVAFGVGLVLIPADVRSPAAASGKKTADILHYGKWMVVALSMAAVYERLDLYLLSRFRGKIEVGIYGGALQLAVIPDFVDGFVQTVLTPKIAPLFAAGNFWSFQRQYLKWSVPAGLLAAAAAVPTSDLVVRRFLPAYAAEIPVFQLLLAGTLFNGMFTPMPAALLNFRSPKTATALTGVGLAIVAVAGLLVIPRHGATGAAVVILAARVVVGSATLFFASRLRAG